MRREEALRLLSQLRPELARFGVQALYLFGSVARDEARPDSDVDVLVEFDGPAKFHPYMDLLFYLEDLFQRPVDLVIRKTLKPRLKETVEREAIHVA